MRTARSASTALAPSPPLVYPATTNITPGLVPDVVPMQPAALAEFMRVLRTPSRFPTAAEWWLKLAYSDWGGCCAYCGKPLSLTDAANLNADTAVVDHLVPLSVGGPHLHDAVVLSCFACNMSKGNDDWLVWHRAADRKTRKRLKLMRDRIGTTETFNHLAPDPSKVWTKLQVERLLAERWAQPRFSVQAALSTGGCFLGSKDRTRPPVEFAAIVWTHHGKAVDVEAHSPNARQSALYFERPRDCLAAIWELVSVNAWVRRSDLRPAADFLPPIEDHALASWVFVSPNVGDLVRRDYAKSTGFKRHSKEWREGKVSMGANGSWAVSS